MNREEYTEWCRNFHNDRLSKVREVYNKVHARNASALVEDDWDHLIWALEYYISKS